MKEKKKRLPTLDDAQAAFAKIPKQLILAFVAACVFFAVFHAGFFDDRMVNEDYRHNITRSLVNIAAGRFFDFYLLTSYFNAWTMGCGACIYFALSSVLMVDMLHIRTKLGAALASALIVGMPALAYMFSFLFSAPLYGRFYFLVILAVWTTDKWRWGFIPAAVILAFSLGVGQGALIAAVVLCVLVLLRDVVFDGEFSYKRLLNKGLRCLIMGVCGVLLYLLIWNMLCKIKGVPISNYDGMDQIGHITIRQLGSSFLRSYKDFYSFFFGSRFFYVSRLQQAVYILLFLAIALSMIYVSALKPIKIPGLIAAILMLPPAVGCIDILVPQVTTDSLMIYPIVFAGVFAVRLAEDAMPVNGLGVGASWVLMGALMITCLSNWDNTSTFYIKSEVFHEQTSAYANRLLSRIEETPGYYPGIPVAIVDNNTNEYRGNSAASFPTVLNDRDMWYSYVGTYTNSLKKTVDIVREYTGVSFTKATAGQLEAIRYSPDCREMAAYPLEGSIRIINGVLTVNTIYREVVIQQAGDQAVLLNYIDHVSKDSGTYAWYVYRNKERVSELERGYREVPEYLVTLSEDGTYTFKGFCNRDGKKESANGSFSVVVKDGIIVADSRMERISMEEAMNRALPPMQIKASVTGDRMVNLTIMENAAITRKDYVFAWRVYCDGEHAEEYDRAFAQDPQYDLNLSKDGTYLFELIYRKGNTGPETTVLSEEIGIAHEIDILRAGKNAVLLNYVGPAAAESNISYAWYVYKEKELVEDKGRTYQAMPEHLVTLEEDGVYTFKCFCMIGKEKRSMLSFPVTVKNGAIADDPRLTDISLEEAISRTKPEIEVQVTVVGERAVKLTMIDNTLHAGPEYTYAWYVYRNGERLEEYERGYYSDPEYDLILAEDGEYQFKLFYRTGKTSYSVWSEKVTIGEAQSNENAA